MTHRRVLLIVVDGCTPRVLRPALARGELPTLAALSARGTLRLDGVSIFPSITPAATASIITGRYPSGHGIEGMSFWNPETGEVSYFGDDLWTVVRLDAGEFVRGFLQGLNGERLRADTMFERVERQGRLDASFNYLVFRGDVEHEVNPPLLLRLLPSVSSRMVVHGPRLLHLGTLVSQRSPARAAVASVTGLFHRFGLDDASTAALLEEVPGVDALADFNVAYFADYDFESHQRGPEAAVDTLCALDGYLKRIFSAWGGLDQVLERLSIVMTADHSHSDIGSGDAAGIALDDLLGEYRLAGPADQDEKTDLLVCPNMRAAEIYVRRPGGVTVPSVSAALLRDGRVDQVIWRDEAGDLRVDTADRGTLRFSPVRDGRAATADEYGGRWRVDGELAAIDAQIDGDRIRYGAYPNALERIANGVGHQDARRLWVTARPGHEFSTSGQEVHTRAGSHGSLHELDSTVPLLLAGEWPALRATPRIVDVASLCAQALGLEGPLPPGAPHL